VELHVIDCGVCGTYRMAPRTERLVKEKFFLDRYLLSGVLRNASEQGSRLEVTTENVSSLIGAARRPRSPLEAMDTVLVHIADGLSKKVTGWAGDFSVYLTSYSRVFLRSPEELGAILGQLAAANLVEPLQIEKQWITTRPTVQGWERVQTIRSQQVDTRQAFVAMSFAPDMTPAWLQGIRPALLGVGYHPFRVDSHEHNGKIDDVIVAELRRSAIVVADFSHHRGGVYFEAGYGMGRGMPVIWTVRQSDLVETHFDTRQYNHVVWQTPDELRERLQTRLLATVPVFPPIVDGAS
jgi:nucleoside 2-deoxyribosyltransferase